MKSKDESISLHWAVCSEIGRTVQLLIEKRTDINIKSKDELISLHWAVCCEDRLLMQLLIEKEADVFSENTVNINTK